MRKFKVISSGFIYNIKADSVSVDGVILSFWVYVDDKSDKKVAMFRLWDLYIEEGFEG